MGHVREGLHDRAVCGEGQGRVGKVRFPGAPGGPRGPADVREGGHHPPPQRHVLWPDQGEGKGQVGALFHFDVHDDVRINNDVRIEKDESHPGKIVDRKWYERNKHIFPASRWEMYSKDKTYDKYTIHGDTDHSRDIKT